MDWTERRLASLYSALLTLLCGKGYNSLIKLDIVGHRCSGRCCVRPPHQNSYLELGELLLAIENAEAAVLYQLLRFNDLELGLFGSLSVLALLIVCFAFAAADRLRTL
jgi:hypothetical protein